MADLQKEEAAERSFRKFRFICDDVQGKNCLCSFYGMSLTSDKLKGVVKKWQSLIECYVDAKTTDGYIVRVGVIGFTDRCRPEQKTCYAQSTQVSYQPHHFVLVYSIRRLGLFPPILLHQSSHLRLKPFVL